MTFLAAVADTCARLLHATAAALDAFACALEDCDCDDVPDTIPLWMDEEADL